MATLVSFRDATLGYGGTPALSGLTLDVVGGGALALVGPNGGGKTTLMRSVVGTCSILSGRVEVNAARIGLVPQSADLDLTFKDLSHFFNLNYMAYYSRLHSNLMPASFIHDFYTFSWLEHFDTHSTYWSNTLTASRLLTGLSLTASLALSYDQNSTALAQQGDLIDYTNRTFRLSPSLKWNARTNLNFDYTASLSYSGFSIAHAPEGRYIPFLDHRLYTYWGLIRNLSLTSTLQHYYTHAPQSSATHLLFADLGLRLSIRRMTISLDWTNILNRRSHVTTTYNTVNTLTRTDRLRPSEFLISFRFKR